MSRLVVLIAPPGAGKGTQADLLQKEHGFVHLETAKIITQKFKEAGTDPIIAREKAKYDAGHLVDPPMVSKWFLETVEKLVHEGKDIVMSGSPRTVFEADAELPFFEKWFGKDNIFVFSIDISEETSIRRNSKRRLCKLNRHPIPDDDAHRSLTQCPQDGSMLEHRGALDTPDIIKKRYSVYLEETAPVIDVMRRHGMDVVVLHGNQDIEALNHSIIAHLDGHLVKNKI